MLEEPAFVEKITRPVCLHRTVLFLPVRGCSPAAQRILRVYDKQYSPFNNPRFRKSRWEDFISHGDLVYHGAS